MGIKRSISISDSSIRFAQARFEEVEWSPAINASLADLQHLLRACLPSLIVEDWLPILDAFNGHFFDYSLKRSTRVSIAACIMDHHGALTLDELPVEYSGAVQRIAKLTQVEQFAVLDVVRRYWIAETAGTLKGDTLKERLEALLAEEG